MPINALFATSPYESLGDDPSLLHGTCIDNVESLVLAEPISPVSLDKCLIPPVELYALLEVHVHGHLLPIIRGHEELLALEFIPHYLRGPPQFVLFKQPLCPGLLTVFINLIVNKGVRKSKPDGFGVIVLVKARVDFPYIIHRYG
jgi:hypothetical protein